MGWRQPLDTFLIEIMKPTPPKHIINTHATINHTHHGISDDALVGVTGREGEPPVGVGAPGIFEPPDESWIIFPGSFLYEKVDAPEEFV